MTETPRRVAVVGGTRGIGRAIVDRFSTEGDRVLYTGRHVSDCATGDPTGTATASATDGAVAVALNVADEGASARLHDLCSERLGGLDVLCLNAGIFPSAPIEQMTLQDIRTVFSINLESQMLAVSACLPLLRQSAAGRVVLTSSITGPTTGFPGWSHYGASKAGQLGFMRTAALELAPFGITVNAVCPGNVLTDGLADMGEEYLAGMARTIPLGRLADPADIAETAFFLASRAAGYITGQAITVDGGQTLPESPDAVLPVVRS